MAHIHLENESGFVQHIAARSHRFTADEPVNNGGTDTAPSPHELWLGGLAACTALTLRMYAGRKGWDLGALTMDLRVTRDADGNESIERKIRLGAPLTGEQRERLAQIAEKTPVTQSVKRGTPIHTTIGLDPSANRT